MVSLSDVGDYRHIPVVKTQAFAQHATACVLQYGGIDIGMQKDISGAFRAAAVAGVDAPSFDVYTIRTGHADTQAEAGENTGDPVSYTHLDVYKRQRNVRPDIGVAVLNAADPMVARMADACPGKVTFFALDRNHPVMAMHRAQGKRVVYLDADSIVATEGGFEQRIPLAEIPVTANGAIGFQIENAFGSAYQFEEPVN